MEGFLHEKLLEQYGETETERIEAGFTQRQPSLRINPLKGDPGETWQALCEMGIAGEGVNWYPLAMIITPEEEALLRTSDIYKEGKVYFQSLSSMLPPLVLCPQAGEDLLDMAAAPGGKTTQMSAMTMGKVRITACERNAARAERLRFNLERQGARGVTVLQMDARQLDPFFVFDRILLDAPCSGSGTLGPENRGSFTKENLAKTARTQKALLERALQALRPGHEMVYSTCSVLREENEEVIEAVMRRGLCEIVSIEGYDDLPLLPGRIAGTLNVCPTDLYEGFFVARLRRKEKRA